MLFGGVGAGVGYWCWSLWVELVESIRLPHFWCVSPILYLFLR